jgi:uncharacterized protein (TIGR03663 family)
MRLWWWNVYRYQPSDYHGPFLYYVNLLCFWLLGPGEKALRMGTAVFGTLLPVLLLPMRRSLGLIGLFTAGLLLAAAPAMSYFSRTCIHEIYLAGFTALWLAGIARFLDQPGRRGVIMTALGAALAFANKETALITAGSLALGVGLAWLLGRVEPWSWDPDLFGRRSRREVLREASVRAWRLWLLGALLFVGLTVLFFSSFFSYWPGVPGFFQAFTHWFDYGVSGRNQGKDWGYFWKLMQVTEGRALWMAAPAAAWALLRRHRFGLLLLGWGASAWVVYEAVPYKTPWCVLNLDLPVFLLVAWGARQAWLTAVEPALHPGWRLLGLLLAPVPLLALPPMVQESRTVALQEYDEGKHPYVYVQTLRGFYELMADLYGFWESQGDAEDPADPLGPRILNIDAKNPTRFYVITRGWDHDRSEYLDDGPKLNQVKKAQIVLATGKPLGEVGQRIKEEGGAWHKEAYPLRPGWKVTAWYRQELWDAYARRGGRGSGVWPIPPLEPERVHVPEMPEKYRKGGGRKAGGKGKARDGQKVGGEARSPSDGKGEAAGTPEDP